jgi:hypothetical protein
VADSDANESEDINDDEQVDSSAESELSTAMLLQGPVGVCLKIKIHTYFKHFCVICILTSFSFDLCILHSGWQNRFDSCVCAKARFPHFGDQFVAAPKWQIDSDAVW